MFDKPFTAVDAADIEALITNQVPEGRKLEYKESFIINSEGEKKEFLADIAAMANTDGGHIIFGIQEHREAGTGKPTGLPSQILGLQAFNADAETLRLESMIRDGLSPRLSGILIKKIDGFPNGPVFLIRIPQSWNSPHMLTFQTRSPFYGRGNAGKYLFDVNQIRSAFTFSDSLSERIRSFHQDRVTKIINGQTSVEMEQKRKLIAHMIPLSAFKGENSLSLESIKAQETHLAPISSHGFSSRVNLEGMVFYSTAGAGTPSYSYVQIYRNGIIEFVDSLVLGMDDERKFIPTVDLEQSTIEGVGRYCSFLTNANISGPAVFLVTLYGIKGFKMNVGRDAGFTFPGVRPRQFDRDLVTIPEILVEELTTAADILLKPIFDAIYNAAGWEKCPHYDAQGRWQFPR